jgi:hypothetical protein
MKVSELKEVIDRSKEIGNQQVQLISMRWRIWSVSARLQIICLALTQPQELLGHRHVRLCTPPNNHHSHSRIRPKETSAPCV